MEIFEFSSSLADLGAFANTSRRIYSIFRNNKASLIYAFLSNQLGPVIADALGLSEIEILDGPSASYIDQLHGVLSTYSTDLASQHNHPAPREAPPLDQVLRLARAYRLVLSVANVYLTCSFNLFDREIQPSCSPSGLPSLLAPVSSSERLRVLRALFRLHMTLHVWDSLANRSHIAEIDRMNMRLCAQWEPWELQQIFCVASFYQRFRDHLPNDNTSFANRESRRREVVTGRVCEFDAFWGYVGQLPAAGEAAWQDTIERASEFPTGPEDAGVEEEMELSSYRRRMYSYSRTTGATERHMFPISLRFDRDHVRAMPFGWVDAFGGHYGYDFLERPINFVQRGKPTHGLWVRLGFVMWDEPRIQALKTSSILSDCKTSWARSVVSS